MNINLPEKGDAIFVPSKRCVTMKKVLPLILLTLLFIKFAYAQSPSDYDFYEKKYPDEMAVFLHKKEHVTIDLAGDSISISAVIYEDLLHLNERANIMAKNKIYTSHFIKVDKLKARTLVPNKNKYKALYVNNYKEMNEDSEGIFYDDTRSVNFVFPGVVPKCRTITEYTELTLNPMFFGSFYFDSFQPVEEAVFSIRIHKDIQLNHRLYNAEDYNIRYETSVKGNYVFHTWTARDMPKISFEKDMPKRVHFSPRIICTISHYKVNGKTVSVLGNIRDLYQWYYSFIKKLNHTASPEMISLVEKITEGTASDLEKVKRIYEWVQDNIKYIAFEDGMRGFIPHDGDYILEKRYGDCKDMASLIHKMLQVAGVKTFFTWIGTRDIPYTYEELPSPFTDNHMIAAYIEGDDVYFLDATSKYTPFGLPSSMIQGKQALIGIDGQHFKVVEVPVVDKSLNRISDTCELKIVNDELVGNGKISFTGYDKVYNSYKLIKADKKKAEDNVNKILNRGNNKFFVRSYEIRNLEDKDKPLEIEYQFSVKDYFKVAGDELYINLNLDKSYFNDLIDIGKRRYPIENDYNYTFTEYTRFKIPTGYVIEDFPENKGYSQEVFGFDIRYELENDVVILKKTYFINCLLLERPQFEEWNEVIKKLNEAYRETLTIKKINSKI